MFKKIIILILLIVIPQFTLGCSQVAQDEGTQNPSYTIGLSQFGLINSFYNHIQEAAYEKCEELGITLISYDANNSVSKQITDIYELIDRGVHALIINPIDSTSLNEVINQARSKSIPVVVIDNPLNEMDAADVTLLANNRMSGYLAGEWLAAKMQGEPIHALLLSGISGAQVSIDRRMGLLNGILEYQLKNSNTTDFTIAAQRYTNWTSADTYMAVQDIIYNGVQFNCIITEADCLAIWALQLLDENGLDKDIYITSAMTDTVGSETKPLILDGEMASGYQSPILFGHQAVDICIKLINGEECDKIQYLPLVLITSENYDEYFNEDGNYR